jgi:hypothetical protein
VSLLERVRQTCKAVSERSTHVQIDVDRIASYASSLPLDLAEHPEHDPASHYLGHGDDTAAFFMTLDAINFGSGYFPHLRKRLIVPGGGTMSGYFTVASSLSDHFRRNGPFSASDLATLSVDDCISLFGQDLGNAPIRELMELFRRALNDLGRYLIDRFDASFVRLIEAAQGSAERLAELLIEMPFYADVARYGDPGGDGLEVCFFKRAQLAAADLALAFDGQGLGRFDDLDRLTIFADNVVPHVLRVDEVLGYREDLLARIDREELIPAGSPQEVEIRACALHAAELLVDELRQAGHAVTAAQLDYILWNRGRGRTYKSRPRHRTRTVYY